MSVRFPPEWLDELRANSDIVGLVSDYVQLKRNGSRYWGVCPFHHEKTASFSVDPEKQLYYCFGCKAGGNVVQFVMQIERMEFVEAVQFLAERCHMALPEKVNGGVPQISRTEKERSYEINRTAARFFFENLYSNGGKTYLQYLYKRGLDDTAIRKFGLGAATGHWDELTQHLLAKGYEKEEISKTGLCVIRENKCFDMFRERVIFPIINTQGKILGFGGRVLNDGQPKYLNSPDTVIFNKRLNVYAANLLHKTNNLKRVILVEGYMDVVSLTIHGVNGVAATLGTALTEQQAKLLKRFAPEIWMAYDGDEAGQKAILRALDILEPLGIPAKVLYFPDGMDPDEYIRAHGLNEFESLKALAAPEYRMKKAAEKYDLSQTEGKTQYAIDCAEILYRVGQPVERENLLRQLSIQTGFDRDVLISQMNVSGKRIETAPIHRGNNDREQKTRKDFDFFKFERKTAEKLAVYLLSEGKISPDLLSEESFSDPVCRKAFAALSNGYSVSALVESSSDDEKEQLMSIFGNEMTFSDQEIPNVVSDCITKLSEGVLNEKIELLKGRIPMENTDRKKKTLQEISDLTRKMHQLQSGRKE